MWKVHIRKVTLAKQKLAVSCIDPQHIVSVKIEVLCGVLKLPDIVPNFLAHDEVDTYSSEVYLIVWDSCLPPPKKQEKKKEVEVSCLT